MVNKCLLLFDGNALIHRAYHAMPPLVLKKTGEDVGAIYGFMSMFLKTVAGYLPQYIVFAFDKKGPTFRHDMYQDYKANRPKAPDDLVGQIIRARQLIAGSGIAYYEADGFEADDIIGTITVAASQKGIKTFIVTGDADAMQLVNENVSVLYPAKGNSFAELKEFTPAEVKEKYGVYPQNIADLKALSGDSSDNIPGVSGIGPKTAIALIEKFGSVEEICRQASQIESARVREIIKQNCLNATFYKTLCLIRCDAPIDIDFIAMQSNKVQSQKLSDDFTTLEFNSLLPRLNALMQIYGYVAKEDRNSPNLNVSAGQYMLVQTLPQLQSLTEALKDVDYFALDTETDGIDALQASLVGLSLSLRSCQSFYVHLPKSTPKEGSQVSMFDFQTPAVGIDGLTLEQIQKSLNPILQKAKIYAHNAKFDMHALKHNGFSVPKCVFDTMLAAYLIGEVNLGLKSLVLSRLGHQMKPIKDLIGSGKNARTMAQIDAQSICDYACADADYTYRLQKIFATEIDEQDLKYVFYDIEMPLMPVLSDMEEAGILLDVDLLAKIGKRYDAELAQVTKDIFELTGRQFNINSPVQLSGVLFDELKLPVLKHTATSRSTDASVLEELVSKHAIVPLLLKYRNISKIKSTYIDALPKMVSPIDRRLHTSFNQTGTATGRISSSDPNLQNIPAREDGGKEIRTAFIAKEGCVLLSADYSQIDLRSLAHLSADSTLIQAFLDGEDIHSSTAMHLFNLPLEKLNQDMRRLAKTVNFGVMYGMSGFGLEKAANLTREEADKFIKNYFEKYPAVSAYFAKVKEEVRQKGYVQTAFGRRRYISDINSQNHNVRMGAERGAINMPVQGTSADIIKIAMVNVFKALKEGGYQSRMLLQVHDELILECPHSEIAEVTKLVKKHMSAAALLRVPLKVEAKIGKNWGEMTDV